MYATVVARRRARGGVEIVAVADGRLVETVTCAADEVADAAARLRAAVAAGAGAGGTADPGALDGASAEEADVLARWIAGRGVVIEHAHHGLSEPVAGGALLAVTRRRLRAAGQATGRPERELADKRVRRPATAR